MSPSEAQRAARLVFGGVQRFREEAHEARGFIRLEMSAREFRLALRRLRSAPTFAAGVLFSLAGARAVRGVL